jgi:anthranilate/para-aminobenzoate synthase component II
LPPDVAAAIEGLVEIAKRQDALIQELRQALHGKTSEKLSADERQLVFEDLEAALSEV